MFVLLLSGDGVVVAPSTTRAQLPLLLNQLVVTTGYALDLATETDTAFDIAVFMGASIIQVDIATETDEAFNVTVVSPPGTVFVPVDLATESDTAHDITAILSASGSYPGVYPGPTTYPWSGAFFEIAIAVETDEAFEITSRLTLFRPVVPVTDLGLTLVAVTEAELDFVPVVPV